MNIRVAFDGASIVRAGVVAAAFALSVGWPAVQSSAAEPASATPRPVATEWAHSTRIILLGTGGGPGVQTERSQPSSLLVVDGRPYLIDAGDGASQQLSRAGFQTYQIHTIFLTHLHIDHDGGLPALIAFAWFNGSWGKAEQIVSPIQIYGPPATNYLLHASLDYLSVSERIFTAGVTALPSAATMFKAHDINIGKQQELVFQDDRIRVTAVQNSHYHYYSGSPQTGQDKSYSYRFDTPAGSIVFTGDTGPEAITAIAKMARGSDVLVSEILAPGLFGPASASRPGAGTGESPQMAQQIAFHMTQEHLTPDDVGRLAAEAHAKVVLLTHYAGGRRGLGATAFTAGVSRHFSGPVIPGMDLFEYDLFK